MQPKVLSEKHTGIFNYRGQAIPFCYWTHPDSSFTIDTVIFLGTGQMSKVPRWVATLAPPGVAVVEGLPHWQSDPSGKDLKDFSEAYTRTAFNTVLANYRLDSANIIAISQAAPGILWMAAKLPVKIQNIGLVTPLGLTRHILGQSDASRLRELKKRAFRTMFQLKQSPLYGPRNFYIFSLLLRVRFLETEPDASDRKYAEGLSHDLLGECRQILKQQAGRHTRFSVFLGGKDVIFPLAEVSAALNEPALRQIEIITLPGMSHTSFATRRDKAALHRIVTTTRS